MSKTKLAVVQIRGTVNTHPDVRKTLELLRLKRKHACVVVNENDVNIGMLQRVKDYVTFGKIDEKAFVELIKARGEAVGGKKFSGDAAKVAKEYFEDKVTLRDFESKYQLKPYFRLHPPKGGFERRGIKTPYKLGGVLGNREEKINDLIVKML